MSDKIQPSAWTPGEIHGIRVCRRPIFREALSRQGWPNRMLLAISTAKALGITMFEIACDGEPPLPATNEGQSSGLFFGTISFKVDGDEEWKSIPAAPSTGQKKESTVTVYAVVVE